MHQHSIVQFKIKVQEASFLVRFLVNFEIFLRPPLANPANIASIALYLSVIIIRYYVD